MVKQSQDAWGGASNWSEVEGAWVLGPRNSRPWSIVHFVGGIFVGAAPQLAYRLFLERLCEKGVLVIATPYASGFDHFSIADEVQIKFDRCLRSLQERVSVQFLCFSCFSVILLVHCFACFCRLKNFLLLALGIHWALSSTY